ncbi:MAG: NAD(P)-dependent oxidoreductase [Methylophilaceae bacterium]|jgi:nucleoside-diphosphate-sugar epimerase
MNKKIIITGGAGIVGINLVKALVEKNTSNIHVIDKNHYNLNLLKKLFPSITTHHYDLSKKGKWENIFVKKSHVFMLHAQISSLNWQDFKKNTIDSTQNVLIVIRKKGISSSDIIHVSSSVVNSMADDYYVRSKKIQENLVQKFSKNILILRPTLMFGLFDRKHLGWLSRFMRKFPIFPIPGNGQYIRQPLFVEDFVKILASTLFIKKKGILDISGKEQITYISIIKEIKKIQKSKTLIIKIPYIFFYILLKIWALFDRNPPFTIYQLKALTIPEVFPTADWESIFNVKTTKFRIAVTRTYGNNKYKDIKLRF